MSLWEVFLWDQGVSGFDGYSGFWLWAERFDRGI